MRTLYLDCAMGAAGDMLTAALFELFPEEERAKILAELNTLGIPGVVYQAEKTTKCGILGTHMCVLADGVSEGEGAACGQDHARHEHACHEHEHHSHSHTHHHSGVRDIEEIVSKLALSEAVKQDILAVYGKIAEAESHVHGKPVREIHFHEVGTMDAIADVTAACLLFSKLSADRILASPVHVGSGSVRCAHGILPVPAPATAYILQGVPIYGGTIQGELCTPTGAAILKHFVTGFGPMPPLRMQAIGYGMGCKNFDQANCVRVMLGETTEEGTTDTILELSCNLDDMTGEEIGFVQERLWEAGALDVFTTGIGMKKTRPGVLLTVLCRKEQREGMLRVLFQHTTTLGVREKVEKRYILSRSIEKKESPFGEVRVKKAKGFGVFREKAEYEDLAQIAKEQNLDIRTIRELLGKCKDCLE